MQLLQLSETVCPSFTFALSPLFRSRFQKDKLMGLDKAVGEWNSSNVSKPVFLPEALVSPNPVTHTHKYKIYTRTHKMSGRICSAHFLDMFKYLMFMFFKVIPGKTYTLLYV